jgi:hypothetical protein
MPAASALIDMTAERRGTTPRNGQQHFDMLPADPLAISFDECSSRAADKIRPCNKAQEAALRLGVSPD